jgi:alpha,alpha-trehalose phosphorylase
VEYDGEILIKSKLDGDVSNFIDQGDPRVSQGHSKLLDVIGIDLNDEMFTITSTTRRSRLTVSCSCIHEYGDFVKHIADKNAHIKNETSIELELRGSGSLNLVKKNVYTDSIRCDNPVIHGKQIMERVRKLSFDELVDMQTKYLSDIWKFSQIKVFGNKEIQDALRFKLFQLIQSVGKDGISNISAKGLSGEGYEGHYFWDTEIYILPVFQLLIPEIAESLLRFRYNILEHSRRRARVLDHKKGVKFPWRTISGMECSTYFPAGTAQYHINGDIAYGVIQHYLINEDLKFIMDYGAEIVFETARTWIDLGHFKNDEFRIDAVTGPDEYTAIVNNNYYTNAVAKYNLYWASKFYGILKEKQPDKLKYLLEKIELDESEIKEFERAYEKMYLAYDKTLKINMQDDTFLNKEVWDFAGTPKDKYPLLLNYHPLNIYRKQVLKQADTVLAHMLLEDYSDDETIKNSFDYYEKITTHDSSLSTCIYGIMASKNGDREKACNYFNETLKLDLENTHGNTKDGLHMANLAGSLLSIIMGFAGLRIKEKGVCLNPLIPEGWEGYEFNFHYRGSFINIHIDEDIQLRLISGNSFTVAIYGKEYTLSDMLSVDLKNIN